MTFNIHQGAAEGIGVKDGFSSPNFIYTRRVFDIQILNSLILFCLFFFVIRIAQRFIMIFSINI